MAEQGVAQGLTEAPPRGPAIAPRPSSGSWTAGLGESGEPASQEEALLGPEGGQPFQMKEIVWFFRVVPAPRARRAPKPVSGAAHTTTI
jgi:hypothetical protein